MFGKRSCWITAALMFSVACSTLGQGADTTTQQAGNPRIAVFNLSGLILEAPAEVDFGLGRTLSRHVHIHPLG